jgi:hypothetical protein
MKNENLHRWLTLLANLGVLVGIILVAVELRQNLTAVRAQTRHDVASGFIDFMNTLAQDEQLASLRRRGDAGEEMSVDDSYRYGAFTRGLFRYWENVHYQYRNGLYDDTEFMKQRAAWRSHAASSPGIVSWWCVHRSGFSSDFAAEYDRLLPANQCE